MTNRATCLRTRSRSWQPAVALEPAPLEPDPLGKCVHYDLTDGRRLRAILNGAVEADRATVAKHMRPVVETRVHFREKYGP